MSPCETAFPSAGGSRGSSFALGAVGRGAGQLAEEAVAFVEVKVLLLAPRRAAYNCPSVQKAHLNIERGLN